VDRRLHTFEDIKAEMRARKPRNVKKRKKLVTKKRLQTNLRRKKELLENHEYYANRVKDFLYYVNRSDLTQAEIARSLNISGNWLYRVYYGKIKRPGEHRVTTIIDFLKDYERLQTYYASVIK
jgi:hypothetical protein